MGIRTRRSQHPRLPRRTRLSIGRCARPSLPVQAIEDRIEEPFAVPYDILERNPSALDVGLGHVCRDGRNVAYLLGEEHPTGNNEGTERQQSGFGIPFHRGYRAL
jgi:hypothetical protein